ncbi:MAG: ferrous iron transport protein A [Candidatus Muirbacterium halophilum]|nr:ferrous iron transport protein A [Candidatus Muirbacterium halophilum]MCK9475889.1 ferrous iron transport protein A [Candidatus Muirbacterium halophilum]
MNLLDLKVGQKAIVLKIDGSRDIKQRLITMGFTKGQIVKLEKIAPLGDPIDFLVKDYHISLRKSEASNIIVEEIKTEK